MGPEPPCELGVLKDAQHLIPSVSSVHFRADGENASPNLVLRGVLIGVKKPRFSFLGILWEGEKNVF